MKSETKSEQGCCCPETETESIGCGRVHKAVPEVKRVELKKMGSAGGKLFRRLLGANTEFQESVSLQERNIHIGVLRNIYYDHQKEIKTALLEAERKKAKAIEMQRRHIIF